MIVGLVSLKGITQLFDTAYELMISLVGLCLAGDHKLRNVRDTFNWSVDVVGMDRIAQSQDLCAWGFHDQPCIAVAILHNDPIYEDLLMSPEL